MKLGTPLFRVERVDSTMHWARESVEKGEAGSGAVFVAGSQTAGRGRHGRSWLSLPGKGLYLTCVLPETVASPAVTLTGALAAAEAAERACGVRSQIKWPNDLLSGGRKWGGLLAEIGSSPVGGVVFLGAGLNLNHREEDFEAELATRSTSLALAAGCEVDGEVLLQLLLARLGERLDDFERGGFAAVAAAYRERAAFAPGDSLEIERTEGPVRLATFRALDDEGRLLLEECTRPLASATVLRVRRGGGP